MMFLKIQFVFALLKLVAEKLESDLPKTYELDDQLFCHVFDEVLQFNRELEQLLTGKTTLLREHCNLLGLFAVEPYFTRLRNIEKKRKTLKFEFEKMNSDFNFFRLDGVC